MSLNRWFALLIPLLTVLLPLPAAALPEDKQQPIQISADSAELDERAGVSTYLGTVKVQQGSLRIDGDKVTIHSDSNGVTLMIAIGKPAHFQQKQQPDQTITHAYAEHLEYQVASGRVILTDNAQLLQDGDTFTGQRIIYDIDKAVVNAFGGQQNDNGRVNMVIQPKKSSDE
jgi:lipopolysaccharide export system protein LptA